MRVPCPLLALLLLVGPLNARTEELAPEQQERLQDGKLVLTRTGEGETAELVGRLLIEAEPDRVLQAILDFSTLPERSPGLRSASVYLDRTHSDGGREIAVAYELKVAGRTVHYHLAHQVEASGRTIRWSLDPSRSNDVEQVDGSFVLEDASGGQTLAIYRATLDTGMAVPGFVAELLSEQSLKGYLRGVRDHAARLAGASTGSSDDG